MPNTPTKARSATLAKGLDVLSYLGNTAKPQSLRQVMGALGMTKPTAHRLLATLADYGMVRFDSSDNTYQLGMRMFELSRQVWQDFDLRGSAVAEMQKLHAATGETISLAILTPDGAVYIDEIQSIHHLREQSRVGQRVPMWNSAIGKTLVSGLAYDERLNLEEADKIEILANGKYKNLAELNHHLDLVNARGYAIDQDENTQGISGVSAPIVDHRGITVAAIGLSGSSQRLNREALHRLGPAIIEATRLASLQAGGSPRPVSSAPIPVNLPSPEIKILAEEQNLIGEGPVLSLDGESVFWVDICHPSIFRYNLSSGLVNRYPQKEMITAVSETVDGLLVASLSGIRILDPETGITQRTLGDPEAHIPTNRFNDGKFDSKGRFWIGSIAFNLAAGAGSLYRIDKDGKSTSMEDGLTLPNGMGWSHDNSTMYLVETAERVIFAFDFDEESGKLSNRRPLIKFDDSILGNPDGMDVDDQDNIWVAMWDGWSVLKYASDGTFLKSYTMPFPRPTSCLCINGENPQVIITSARIRVSDLLLKEHPFAGSLVTLPMN